MTALTALSHARGFATVTMCAAVLVGLPVQAQVEQPARPLPAGPVNIRPIISAARTIVLGTVTAVEPFYGFAARDSVLYDLKKVSLAVSDVFRGTVTPTKTLELRQIVPPAFEMAVGDQFLWFVATDPAPARVPLIGMYAGSFRVSTDAHKRLVASTVFDNRGLWDETQPLWDVYPRARTEDALRAFQSPALTEERIQQLMEWGEQPGSQRPIPVDLLRALSGVRPLGDRRHAAR